MAVLLKAQEHKFHTIRAWIIDNYCDPCPDIPPQDWEYWEAHYNNDLERGKLTSRAFDKMPDHLNRQFARLRQRETVDWFRQMTDIDDLVDDPVAHGAGLHYSWSGSFLQGHLDYQRHPKLDKERRMNLLLFVHQEWKKEWGGQLLFFDGWGNVVGEVDPMPGRLVAFECGLESYHGVREIRAPIPRVSCAVYYLSDPRITAYRRRAMFFPNRGKDGIPDEVRMRESERQEENQIRV